MTKGLMISRHYSCITKKLYKRMMITKVKRMKEITNTNDQGNIETAVSERPYWRDMFHILQKWKWKKKSLFEINKRKPLQSTYLNENISVLKLVNHVQILRFCRTAIYIIEARNWINQRPYVVIFLVQKKEFSLIP